MKLASRVIISKNNQVLLGKRTPGSIEGEKWCIPGGKVDPSETPQAAAIREVKEETGIDLKNLHFQLVDIFGEWWSVIFFCHVAEDTIFEHDQEHSEMGWFSAQEIEAMKDLIAFNHYQLLKMFFEL